MGKSTQKSRINLLDPKIKTGRKDEPLIPELKVLKHEEIHEALLYIQDVLERSQINFVLLDEIAKKIYEEELPQLDVREIDIGILRREWHDVGRSLFKMIVPEAEWHTNTISLKKGRVPIVMWIIDNHLDVFKNPDSRWYTVTEFKLPNPFNVYWNKRNMIK